MPQHTIATEEEIKNLAKELFESDTQAESIKPEFESADKFADYFIKNFAKKLSIEQIRWFWAVRKGNIDTVKAIPINELTVTNALNANLLHWAACYNQVEVFDYLLEKQDKLVDGVDYDNSLTPLHYAIDAGACEIVKKLIDKNPQIINAKFDSKRTLLDRAAAKGYQNIVQYLAEKGAELGKAILFAAVHGQLEIIKHLLKKYNKPTSYSLRSVLYKAFARAVGNNHIEIVNCFFDTQSVNQVYVSTLNSAIHSGHFEMAKLICTKAKITNEYYNRDKVEILFNNIIEKRNLTILTLVLAKLSPTYDNLITALNTKNPDIIKALTKNHYGYLSVREIKGLLTAACETKNEAMMHFILLFLIKKESLLRLKPYITKQHKPLFIKLAVQALLKKDFKDKNLAAQVCSVANYKEIKQGLIKLSKESVYTTEQLQQVQREIYLALQNYRKNSFLWKCAHILPQFLHGFIEYCFGIEFLYELPAVQLNEADNAVAEIKQSLKPANGQLLSKQKKAGIINNQGELCKVILDNATGNTNTNIKQSSGFAHILATREQAKRQLIYREVLKNSNQELNHSGIYSPPLAA